MSPSLSFRSQTLYNSFPNAFWRILTAADKLLIVGVLVFTIGLFVQHSGRSGPRGSAIVVELAGKGAGSYGLEEGRILRFAGPLGVSEVEIAQEMAWIRSAPCPHKICMSQGKLAYPGDVAACLPNRLVVRVVGGARRLDGISR